VPKTTNETTRGKREEGDVVSPWSFGLSRLCRNEITRRLFVAPDVATNFGARGAANLIMEMRNPREDELLLVNSARGFAATKLVSRETGEASPLFSSPLRRIVMFYVRDVDR
jgi:hypothetical protein